MAEMYRIPKNVYDEALTLDLPIADEVRNCTALSLESVIKVRDTWGMQNGTDWATNICSKVENRVQVLLAVDEVEAEPEEEKVPDLSEELNELLANVVAFYFKAHGAHWNVMGPDFAEYHELFGEIYEDSYESIDPIAENVRKLGKPALAGLSTIALTAEITDTAADVTDARILATEILSANEMLIGELAEAFDCAIMHNQQGIANFLAERIDAHQKWKWQLSSSLGVNVMNPDPINEEIVEEEPRKAEENAVIEERKSAIARAEKITMDVEIRALDTEDGSIRIGGYAATFNKEATGLNFREVIAPGAFTRTLQTDNPVFLLVNHDMGELPLAATQSGTLRLSEDQVGLRMDADLDPSNPRAAEVASALRRGDVSKMSFAFTVAEGGQTREEGLRTLTDLDLYEVSIVTMPAYDSTTVGLRTAQEDLELQKRKLAIEWKQYSLRKKRKG
jgi:hypothetical protein